MTFEADVDTLVKSVCPRFFMDFAPVGTARPYVTAQQVGGSVINPLANDPPGSRNSELQINVWANSRREAMMVSRAIEDAMRAATAFIARPVGAAVAVADPDVPVYGARQDFSCWHTT
jgi:hypothetical protein